MLSDILIRDFTIIDRLELALRPGMTVLTGETGAGKSIIIDAVGMALGERADSGCVRNGGERAEIQLSFTLDENAAARAWLAAQELEADGECIVRRTIQREGGSRAYINGRAVPAQQLRELGDLLLDIHGQHQHQSLLKKDVQRALLDQYGGHSGLAAKVAGHAQRWRQTKKQIDELQAQRASREERIAFLRFQVQELDHLHITPGEWARLEEDYKRLANAGDLIQRLGDTVAQLEDSDDAVNARLHKLLFGLQAVSPFEPRIENTINLLDGALIQLQEAAGELRAIADRLDIDPARLGELELRMSAIHDAARKHRVRPDELPALHARYVGELAKLDHSDQTVEELEILLKQIEVDYRNASAELTARRQRAAQALNEGITLAMRELGMPGGQFDIQLTPEDGQGFTAHGMERVEFWVATNPGQPQKPLAKVVSGGELSRISLAILVMTAQIEGIPTLIFDEVDVGIGGGVAETVGEKLRTLGGRRQVLCVTHLPQVAAQGHQHWRVQKEVNDGNTRTHIEPLSETERIFEIARMLGGVEITDKTRAHAQEILEHAQRTRESVELIA